MTARGETSAAELPLAAAIGAGAVFASCSAAPGWPGAAGAALAVISAAIAVIDRRKLIIPDKLNASALLIGLAASGLTAESALEGVLLALARATFMFAVFFGFRAAYRRLRGVEGIGLGDVKLAAVAGAWLDWASLPLAVDIAASVALTAALVQRLRGAGLDMRSKLPFGAFFAPAIWLCWFLAALNQNALGPLGLAPFNIGR